MKLFFTTLVSLLLLAPMVHAKPYQYVSFNYNIESDGKMMTDAECNRLFNQPEYYNHENDTPIYASNKQVTFKSYKRTGVTYISENQHLLSGYALLNIAGHDNNHPLKQQVSFYMDTNTHRIIGHWRIPSYCRGNLIGTEQQLNKWVIHH